MDKSKKFVLNFLKDLEKIFPNDQVNTIHSMDLRDYDSKAVQTLLDNDLIEPKEYNARGVTEDISIRIASYKITSKGIEFLNGLKQKTTNRWIITLTIILTIMGTIQIIISLVK